MKAIILASGSGSRLLPLTGKVPKSLLKVNSKTILDIEIGSLVECGIRDIIVTTGYHADKMEKHIKSRYQEINITLIENEKYDTTNNIYSMWLTKDFVDDDLVLLHGDTVFEQGLLQRLIMSEFPNAVLVNSGMDAPGKDFKAEVAGNTVKRIGVGLNSEKAHFCAPIYKLTASGFRKWTNQIKLFIEEGNVTCYAEDAFNEVADDISMGPVYYGDELCMEIDTLDDLEKAREYYKNRPHIRGVGD
ncbi:MAG: phosphocholine cytidylyltransferase family protein [Thermodesulfobacteriota bacterium]